MTDEERPAAPQKPTLEDMEYRLRAMELMLLHVFSTLASRSNLVRSPLQDMLGNATAILKVNETNPDLSTAERITYTYVKMMIERIDQTQQELHKGEPLKPQPVFSVVPPSSPE